MPDTYIPRIPFWTRQQGEAFDLSRDQPYYMLAMEPRTGKSKPTVDTACYHFERPSSPLHITGVLVVAFPNGVHRGWITDAFPENVPDRIKWKGFIWRSDKAQQVGYKKDLAELNAFDGLAVLSINAEALPSEVTRKAIGVFLKARRRVMVVADESSFMVNAGARRYAIMLNLGIKDQVVIRRCLDGTPSADGGPLDYYTQMKFLHWSILGFRTKHEFEHHYAEWEIEGDWPHRQAVARGMKMALAAGKSGETARAAAEAYARGVGKTWPALKGYRNIEELQRKIAPYCYRATFAECFNTPRKVYQKRYFELSLEQRRVYNELREELRATLSDGSTIDAAHVLTNMLRAQQITSNYYPAAIEAKLHEACDGAGCEVCDETGVVRVKGELKLIDEKHNPRLEALEEELKDGKPTIVWARFRYDVDNCMELAKRLGMNPCRYDGTVSADAKTEAKDGFQAGRYGAIVCNLSPNSGATRGISLWRASGHVFYSNGHSLRTRLQAEDRAEIAHRTTGTSIVDLVAEDTVDDLSIIPALREKMDVAAYVMKDKKREWL